MGLVKGACFLNSVNHVNPVQTLPSSPARFDPRPSQRTDGIAPSVAPARSREAIYFGLRQA